ncbi:hypothetical protein NFB56_14855 [Yersinia ruckeri]|uniref:hypothetical protein n=1 Tax=Yersinia ruckeri TaxID=29486 RepID=UPI000B28F99A|nr:hypothetical protein [Yersinia ruckeri]MCW6550125.1 hypothetical protein [Yersinia ruckeri]
MQILSTWRSQVSLTLPLSVATVEAARALPAASVDFSGGAGSIPASPDSQTKNRPQGRREAQYFSLSGTPLISVVGAQQGNA